MARRAATFTPWVSLTDDDYSNIKARIRNDGALVLMHHPGKLSHERKQAAHGLGLHPEAARKLQSMLNRYAPLDALVDTSE